MFWLRLARAGRIRGQEMDYRIAVCDDEPVFIERIRQILLDCEIQGYTDSGKML